MKRVLGTPPRTVNVFLKSFMGCLYRLADVDLTVDSIRDLVDNAIGFNHFGGLHIPQWQLAAWESLEPLARVELATCCLQGCCSTG